MVPSGEVKLCTKALPACFLFSSTEPSPMHRRDLVQGVIFGEMRELGSKQQLKAEWQNDGASLRRKRSDWPSDLPIFAQPRELMRRKRSFRLRVGRTQITKHAVSQKLKAGIRESEHTCGKSNKLVEVRFWGGC